MTFDKFKNELNIGESVVAVINYQDGVTGPHKIISMTNVGVYVTTKVTRGSKFYYSKSIISAKAYKQTNPEFFI